MATIPPPKNSVHYLIDKAWHDAQPSNHRAHLGASIIGRECSRELWYTFHWVTDQKHDGRLLRLFNRGQEEERRFVRDLRMAGIEVCEHDPSTGRQFEWSEFGGHFGGSGDGLGINIPPAESKQHVIEMKTHGDKSFQKLAADGVQESKPEHYVQMQMYMHWSGLERALYLAVNKNDDTLHSERVKYDRVVALEHIQKARDIIASDTPPVRVRENPEHYYCAHFCDHRNTCHGTKVAAANCRTCVSSSPAPDGTWNCSHFDTTISEDTQRKGGECPAHLFIPDLVPFADAVDADEAARTIKYKLKGSDDFFFGNGIGNPPQPREYTSRELQHLRPELISDLKLEALVQRFDGEIVGYEPAGPDTGDGPGCDAVPF